MMTWCPKILLYLYQTHKYALFYQNYASHNREFVKQDDFLYDFVVKKNQVWNIAGHERSSIAEVFRKALCLEVEVTLFSYYKAHPNRIHFKYQWFKQNWINTTFHIHSFEYLFKFIIIYLSYLNWSIQNLYKYVI